MHTCLCLTQNHQQGRFCSFLMQAEGLWTRLQSNRDSLSQSRHICATGTGAWLDTHKQGGCSGSDSVEKVILDEIFNKGV